MLLDGIVSITSNSWRTGAQKATVRDRTPHPSLKNLRRNNLHQHLLNSMLIFSHLPCHFLVSITTSFLYSSILLSSIQSTSGTCSRKVDPDEVFRGGFFPAGGAFTLSRNRSFYASFTKYVTTLCRCRLHHCAHAHRTAECWLLLWWRWVRRQNCRSTLTHWIATSFKVYVKITIYNSLIRLSPPSAHAPGRAFLYNKQNPHQQAFPAHKARDLRQGSIDRDGKLPWNRKKTSRFTIVTKTNYYSFKPNMTPEMPQELHFYFTLQCKDAWPCRDHHIKSSIQ